MNTTLFLLIRLSTNLDLFFQVLVIVQPFESFFQSSPYRPNQYYLPTCPCLQWCSSCCRRTSPTLVPGINSLLRLLILLQTARPPSASSQFLILFGLLSCLFFLLTHVRYHWPTSKVTSIWWTPLQ